MDYEQMSVQELREACQARSLGTARSRAELIQRLTNNDATASEERHEVVEAFVPATPETAPSLFLSTGEPAAVPRVLQKEFPAEPGGPDEEVHLACRQSTVQAAIEAGLTPRGDARLAQVRGDVWVYEVSVRAGEPS